MMFSHVIKELSTEKERERAGEVEEGECMTSQARGRSNETRKKQTRVTPSPILSLSLSSWLSAL